MKEPLNLQILDSLKTCTYLSPNPTEHILQSAILKYSNLDSGSGRRLDVGKILQDYQKKFKVPKVLIKKWLGITNQVSQFKPSAVKTVDTQSSCSESEISIIDFLELSKSNSSISISDESENTPNSAKVDDEETDEFAISINVEEKAESKVGFLAHIHNHLVGRSNLNL